MAKGFYLGKVFDPEGEGLGEQFVIDPDDLTTHGLVVGMTGSGKTGLSAVMIEECLRGGIPVIAIDPKGDLANLGLCFETLEPAQFKDWVDRVATDRAGQTVDEAAEQAAESWRTGLSDWDIGPAEMRAYKSGYELRILTPGSTSGIPVSLVDSMEPPPLEVLEDPEEFREQVDAVVSALLGLVRIEADPVSSMEYILLHSLIGDAWAQGQRLTLESLINSVASPPFEKLGALPLETVYPQSERRDLMLALNGILASPQLEAWRQGEPIDIDSWLRTPDGRPRLTIVYTAHLEDRDRLSVTALVLNRIKSWMRRQPGTGDLRCLVYMDEIYGYFPPSANPPTKQPLLTLLKQARAFGVGVLLATQNPVDLDYKGLANMGFWAIGRLQTPQDQERVREGVEAALEGSDIGFDFDEQIAGVQKRVFLVHDIHRKAPALVHSRWAMSYLRGPMTRQEVSRLVALHDMKAAEPDHTVITQAVGSVPSTASVSPSTAATEPPVEAKPVTVAPVVAAPTAPAVQGLQSRYWGRYSGTMANPNLFVRAAVRYKAGSVLTEEETRDLVFPLAGAGTPNEALESEPLDVDESQFTAAVPQSGVSFSTLPSFLEAKDAKRQIERALRGRLDDRLALNLWYDPETRTLAQPGEDADSLAERVRDAPKQSKKRTKLESGIQKKRMQLEAKRGEKKSRGIEKWVSLGTAILSNARIFTGRKRTVTGTGSILTKSRMENTTEARIEQLEADILNLEEELAGLEDVDTSLFEQRLIKPTSTNVAIIRYEIVWIY